MSADTIPHGGGNHEGENRQSPEELYGPRKLAGYELCKRAAFERKGDGVWLVHDPHSRYERKVDEYMRLCDCDYCRRHTDAAGRLREGAEPCHWFWSVYFYRLWLHRAARIAALPLEAMDEGDVA